MTPTGKVAVLLLVLLGAFSYPTDALLETVPDNEAVLPGSNVTLRCSAHLTTPGARVMWIEYTVSQLGVALSDLRTVFASHPNAARYTIVGEGLDYYLHIRDVRLTDGGRYQCSDAEGQRPGVIRGSAELIVLESEPVCNEITTSTGLVLENRFYVYECLIGYQGFYSPTMKWEGPGEFIENTYTTGSSVWRSAMFSSHRSMEGQSFVCTTNFTAADSYPDEFANNPPSYVHVHTGMALVIAWPPLNQAMTVSPIKETYVEGDVLTCAVDAKPQPTFRWFNMRTIELEEPGATYVIPPELVGFTQTMRCDAQINLEQTLFTSFIFQDVNVPECDDLTGNWVASNPSARLCLEVDSRGNMLTLLRNGTDLYFISGTGKTVYDDFKHMGFTSHWPHPRGVAGFVGECHKCFGTEVILLSGLARNRLNSADCGVSDGTDLTRLYVLTRFGPSCRDAELDVYNPNPLQMKRMGVRARAYNGPV